MKNKFQIVADRMETYCAECEFRKSGQCLIEERSCDRFEAKYRELYFELLYPKHPCRFCIVRPSCDVSSRCEDYRRHQNMRKIAKSELKGEDIDVELPDRCIGELRGDPLYADILETERQYVDYRNKNGG